jgi:hypothetical protein
VQEIVYFTIADNWSSEALLHYFQITLCNSLTDTRAGMQNNKADLGSKVTKMPCLVWHYGITRGVRGLCVRWIPRSKKGGRYPWFHFCMSQLGHTILVGNCTATKQLSITFTGPEDTICRNYKGRKNASREEGNRLLCARPKSGGETNVVVLRLEDYCIIARGWIH